MRYYICLLVLNLKTMKLLMLFNNFWLSSALESQDGSVGSVFDSDPISCWFESHTNWTFRLSPWAVFRDWVVKGPSMSSRVYATGLIKDPVPLIENRRGLSPSGRFTPGFIHRVIIITGLNKLYDCMFPPWRLLQMPTWCKAPTHIQSSITWLSPLETSVETRWILEFHYTRGDLAFTAGRQSVPI